MARWVFYGTIGSMLFRKKHICTCKLAPNGRKQNETNEMREKTEQKRSPSTGVERIYALPTAQQVRCVTD